MTLHGARFNGFQWSMKTKYPPLVAQRRVSESMINWSGVCEIASGIRGVTCRLGCINFGGVNIVRQLTFDDNVQWVVRIPMPRRIIGDDGSFTIQSRTDYWTQEQAEGMKSEVYTMIYIRDHSDIPVPEVFGFDASLDNPAAAPYIFMECIMGNSIMDLSREVPEQQIDKLHAAIAKFQLSTLHFDQVGNINKDVDGDFVIGPIPGIGGPFCNAADYYRAWALFQGENPRRRGKSDPFPERVSRAAQFLSEQPFGPFTLSHPDFGYHNFLIDDDYNMLAVIDWSGASIQPIEFSAVLPMFLCSLHPIFWKGGRFDNEERRSQEAKLAAQQVRYVEVIYAEAQRCQAISVMAQQSHSLRIMIAEGMVKYDEGNLNPWEWLVDLLEGGIDDVGSGSTDYRALRGDIEMK